MDVWDLMQHWEYVLPPSRPSAAQLARIKFRIGDVDRSKPVAILGSTPEFRDLLFECGFGEIYLLERNLTFLGAMSALRIFKNTEHIVEGDWRTTLPLLKAKFAVVLSDLTSGNIPYADRAIFYEAISGALSPGGLFLDKVLTHRKPNISVDALFEKYSRLPVNLLYINHFSSEMLFCSELLEIKGVVDSTLFYELLDKRVRNARVRRFVNEAMKITPLGGQWWYGRNWDELQPTYCNHLTVLKTFDDEATSPYHGRLKFFEFRKD
jgi:hypothetical protein